MVLNYSQNPLVVTLILILISGSSVSIFAQNEFTPEQMATGRYSQADPNGYGVGEGASSDDQIKNQNYYSKNTPTQSSVASAGVEASILNGCNCVVFRLDDIQDFWLPDVQITVMDQFVQKNQYLSAGPVMAIFGADSNVVNKVVAGYNSGLFEIFVHGWTHVDHTTLNLATQTSTLQDSQDKLQLIFGSQSIVFIPPYNAFNANTLTALQSTGFEILSAAEYTDEYSYFIADGVSDVKDPLGLYHLPESIGFVQYGGDGPIRIPNTQILDAIDSSINSKGYAVVTIHSQEFAELQGGSEINSIDQDLIDDLNFVIDGILLKNYSIRTFNQAVQYNQFTTPDTEKPVIIPTGISSSLLVGSTYTELGATVTDNDPSYSETVVIGGNTVDTSTPGDYIITYNAPDDAAGNTPDETSITITVESDTEKPVITPTGTSESVSFGSVYTELGATVTDNDPSYSETVVIGGNTVDTSTPGDYIITYNAPDDAAGNTPDETSITITIIPPTITINDATQTEGNSGATNFEFTVTRSTNTSEISVQYQTVDNTASAPADYSSLSSTLNFADNGSLTQTIAVSVNGDSVFESDEAFNVNLSNCVGCTIADNQGIGTIEDDDTPPPIFSDDFESGFSKWTETGEGDWKLESPGEKQVPGHSSNLVAHSDNCDSTCTITMSNSIDLSAYSSATLSFWRYVDSELDNGEYLKVELYDGTQWNTISNWTNNAGDDDTWHQESVNLEGYLDTSDFNVRFVTHQSGGQEEVEIDDVEINTLTNFCESLPVSGDWIITSTCILENDFTSPVKVIVQNGAVLKIPNGVILTIGSGHNITIESGGGVMIKSGGGLQINS